MKVSYRFALSLVLCAFSTAIAADETPAPQRVAVDPTILLDPEADRAARLEQLHALKANAKAGGHADACLLGRLAFAGSRHPAELPEFDFGDAATWLSRCVLGGDLDAMLVMAELELANRRPLEAMVWMQGYLKLAGSIDPQIVNSASPYKAGILARIEKMYSGKRPDNEEVLEYVAGFLASHGERILAGHANGGWDGDLPVRADGPVIMESGTRSLAGRFTRDMRSAEEELVYAKFLVEIDGEGRPGRVLVVESYPDREAARALRSHPRSRRFNPVEPAVERWVYMPVYIDNKAYDLMPEADEDYRPRG